MTLRDPMASRRAQVTQELDHGLVSRLVEYAAEEFGSAWLDGISEAVFARGGPPADQEELGLLMPLALFVLPAPGDSISVCERFLLDAATALSKPELELLHAQRKAVCSLWMAEKVQRGEGIALRNLLTREQRFVHERLGSRSMEPGDVILARVLDVNDVSILAGIHPQPMHADRALMLADGIRREFGARTRALKWGELFPAASQLMIVTSWREWVTQAAEPPMLHNSDGDPLAPTVDHYSFDPAREHELADRLARITGAVMPDAGAGEREIVITRAPRRRSARTGGPVVTGVLRFAGGRLRVESNSTKRADALRKAVERAAGGLLRHSLREESNLDQAFAEIPSGGGERARPDTPPELLEEMRRMKREHYERWLDERIPMLGGKTPRQAAKSKAARQKLLALVAGLERVEGMLPADERMDVGWIKSALGIAEE